MDPADHYTDIYRECLRNHAASLGSYATDGCGEFTLDDTQPGTNLSCVACGCHRNFHRKVTRLVGAGEVAAIASAAAAAANSVDMMEYSGGTASGRQESTSGKKRYRTKFTEEQKEKMLEFAEKLGWRLQRKLDHGGSGDPKDEDEIERFCRGVGISRKVFKVWMHNHKNSPSPSRSPAASLGNASSLTHQ